MVPKAPGMTQQISGKEPAAPSRRAVGKPMAADGSRYGGARHAVRA